MVKLTLTRPSNRSVRRSRSFTRGGESGNRLGEKSPGRKVKTKEYKRKSERRSSWGRGIGRRHKGSLSSEKVCKRKRGKGGKGYEEPRKSEKGTGVLFQQASLT